MSCVVRCLSDACMREVNSHMLEYEKVVPALVLAEGVTRHVLGSG